MQKRKTKIVCSIGPSCEDDKTLSELISAGMNVARINMSHGTHESYRQKIEQVRKVSGRLGIPVAILLDTKGPEIRTGMAENDGKIKINKGDNVAVTTDDCITVPAQGEKPARLSISWKSAPEKMKSGHHILVADGLLDLEVLDVTNGIINCRANNTAVIGSKKNVNLSGIHAQLPIMSEQDKKDIALGAEMDVDFVAASFLSFPHEVIEIRKYLESLNSSIKIIAKIESGEGLENILEIALHADGIMVARGDLGVQLPAEQIPFAQKHIINVCRKVGKPVITATQMLESMIVNPRPTRAEVTDIANAILDGTDAVMLSGETAAGAYPVEAVQTMDKIACTVEQSEEFRTRMKLFHDECFSEDHNPQDNMGIIMSRSGVEVASAIKAKAIVTPTLSGNTARLLSVFRPDEPVFAITPNEHTERIMQLYWGVHTCHAPYVAETESKIQNTIKTVLDKEVAGMSDKIVLVAGLPLHSPNYVNNIRVIVLGNILARAGSGGFANSDITRTQGKIIHAVNPNDLPAKNTMSGSEILVCKELTRDYIPVIKNVKGIICETVCEINEKELRDINPGIVWLNRVKRAAEILEPGITVTIDAKELLVYEGTV